MHPAVMYHYLVPKLCLFAFLCKETDGTLCYLTKLCDKADLLKIDSAGRPTTSLSLGSGAETSCSNRRLGCTTLESYMAETVLMYAKSFLVPLFRPLASVVVLTFRCVQENQSRINIMNHRIRRRRSPFFYSTI